MCDANVQVINWQQIKTICNDFIRFAFFVQQFALLLVGIKLLIHWLLRTNGEKEEQKYEWKNSWNTAVEWSMINGNPLLISWFSEK